MVSAFFIHLQINKFNIQRLFYSDEITTEINLFRQKSINFYLLF